MKLLCVERNRGRPMLKVGEIYTKIRSVSCPACNQVWYAVAETPLRRNAGQPGRFVCTVCSYNGGPITIPPEYEFRARRFVPWNPDQLGITTEEIERLYNPTPNLDEVVKMVKGFKKAYPAFPPIGGK